MNDTLDIGFIKRVYRTSTLVWLFALLICWMYLAGAMAAGITVGFVISVGSLMIIERLVTTLFTADSVEAGNRPTRRIAVLAFVKYLIIGAVLWASLRSGWVSPAGIAIGIGLPYIVIMLKSLGRALTFGSKAK